MCTCKVLKFSQIPKALQYRSNPNSNRHVHVLSHSSFSSKLWNLNEQIKLITSKSIYCWHIEKNMVKSQQLHISMCCCAKQFQYGRQWTKNRQREGEEREREREVKLFLLLYNLWNYRWINDCFDSFMQLSWSSEEVTPKTHALSTLSLFPSIFMTPFCCCCCCCWRLTVLSLSLSIPLVWVYGK